jgi:hypothetical protein
VGFVYHLYITARRHTSLGGVYMWNMIWLNNYLQLEASIRDWSLLLYAHSHLTRQEQTCVLAAQTDTASQEYIYHQVPSTTVNVPVIPSTTSATEQLAKQTKARVTSTIYKPASCSGVKRILSGPTMSNLLTYKNLGECSMLC